MKKIYTAHPFNLRYKIKDWLNDMEKKELDVEFINPFFPKRDTEKFDKDSKSCDEYYKILNPITIVQGDVSIIAECDAMVCIITDDLSYGTIQEMVYGKFLGKEIYTICTNGHERHPWIVYHSTKVFKTFEEFEEFIK